MAYIVEDTSGWKICYRDGSRKIRGLRIGKDASKQAAAEIAIWVERLNSARNTNSTPDAKTLRWLQGLSDSLHTKLARLGLTEARPEALKVALGTMLTDFFATIDVKPATKTRMEQAKAALIDHFKEGRDIATISEADAEEWRAQLKKDGYAGATISRTVGYSRQFFRWAIRRGKVNANPFAALKAGSQSNSARQVFIDRETIAKVMNVAPDAEWRLLIALSRYGGLRVPSEALVLRWGDVDFEHNRLTVRSCKTEGHDGKGERIIPLFPEIRGLLKAGKPNSPCRIPSQPSALGSAIQRRLRPGTICK